MPTWAPSTTTGMDEISTSTSVPSFRARRAIARIHSPSSVLPDVGADLLAGAPGSPRGPPCGGRGPPPPCTRRGARRPGFHPTTWPSRSMVTIATGLVSTSASEYCFWRWISRNRPALWMASTDWAAKVWRVGDDLGRERAPLPPDDDQAAEEPVFPDERQREQGAHALLGQERSHLGSDQLALVLDVGDLDGLPDHAGAPDGALPEAERCGAQDVEVVRGDAVGGPRAGTSAWPRRTRRRSRCSCRRARRPG